MSTTNERIPEDVLLDVLLEHQDFKDFKKSGNDYRNLKGEQSLTEKGLKNFKSEEFKSLFELAKDKDLLDEARRRAGLDEGNRKQTKTKSTKTSSGTSDHAAKLWKEAKAKTPQVKTKAQQYLEGQRKIPLSAYEDLIKSGWLRYHAKEKALVYPIVNPATQLADAKKIQRIFLNETGERTERKMLGNAGKLSVIPPKTSSPSGSNPAYLVIEGLESALSIRNDYPDFSFLITNGKANLKHVPEFLPDKATVFILSDHDNNEKPNQNGQTDAAKLRTVLRDRGYTVFASMSKEPKIDANDALREDRLEQWRSELIDVPELPEEQKPTEASLSELSHWLYLDIKSSQVLVFEDKAAQQFITLHPDLDFADQQAVKKEILAFLRDPPCKSNVILNSRVIDQVHRMCLYTKGLDLNGYQLDIEDLNESQTHRLIWIDDQNNEESLFPHRITQYLKKVSKSLDLDFEAAAVEFLLSCSIALGGNKLIRVNDQWTENGCLWIAQVAASGIGKSPLTQMCGGRYIAEIHRRWDEEFEASKLAWEEADAETRKELVKPKRRRISEHSLTMERLFALHNDNPEGLGMVVDELRTIIDGLNQYKKSSGNDSPKLLSLWTGQRITNPVANDDRVLQRSYVPIGGGLQTDLLARIVNPAFEADGMAARFLFHFPQRSQTVTHPKDRDAIVNSITDQEKREFSQTLQRLIDSRDGGKDQLGYIKPIELTSEAHDLLQELQFQLETDSRKAGPGLREAYPKLVSYLYRMALLLHEINGHRSEKIQLSIAEKAVKALLFFTANARKAYGEAGLNRETRQARRVLQWIQDQGGQCRQRDLSNALRRQFKTRSACNRMVQQLCMNGFLAMEQDGKAGVIRLIDKTEFPN